MKRLIRWPVFACILVGLLPMCACFSWTQEPNKPTQASPGSTSVLQWNFEPAGDSFWFLLVSRNTSTSNNSSEEDIALKLSNGSTHVYDEFKSRAELINQATLVLHDIKDSDVGRYCCKAFFMQGMYTSCVDLLVLVPPAIVIPPINTTIIEFNELLSFCNASGQPRPTITWRRKDKEQVFPPGEYFTLPNVSRDDTGLYECIAQNSVGQVSVQFRINVLYQPTAHVIPGNLTVNQSDVITLTCLTSGNPSPNVTWTVDGNTSAILSADNKLELIVTSKANEGRYRCTASNGIGLPSISTAYVFVKHHRPMNTSFISCSSDNTAWVNDGIVFTCSSVSSPSPATYIIYHNGKIIKKNKSGYHKICNVKLHHAGTYTCEPRNTFGVGERRSIRLTVYEKVAVHVIPRVMNVTEGSPVLLTCKATGSPPPNITWTSMSSGEIYNGGKLEIKSVQRNDTGDYQCSASNGMSNPVKDTAFLNVYYAPTITNTAGPNVIVNEGGTLQLYCHGDGNPQPIITWKLLGTNQSLHGEDERLIMQNTQKSQAGVYLCTASNFLGNDSKTIAVEVWYKPFNTSLQSSAKSSMMKFNSSVTITCRTNSIPPPHIYTFYKDGVVVQKGTAESFNIAQVSYHDQGSYECVPENTLGRDFSAVLNLTVQRPPFVIDGPRNQTINESDALLLTCNVGGNPSPNISWFDDSNKELATGSVLFISHANRSHAGSYRCIASNGLGNAVTSQATVLINYKPIVLSGKKNISSWIGDETQVQCRAEGFPLPTIHWSAKGVVTTLKLSKTTAQSTLTVTPTSQSDFTVYSCYAQNKLGYDSASFILEQLVTPDPPVITHLEFGSSFIRVTWKAPASNIGEPATSYIVQAVDEKNPNNVFNCSDVTHNSCTIYGLEPETTYLVRIQATNVEGHSFSAHEKVVTKYKGYSKSKERETENEGNKGISTTMFISVLAGIGGVIVFIVVVSLLVKRRRSTGKATITKE
ncbi:hemicentin-2-like isoform X2 [Oculina patagonica]